MSKKKVTLSEGQLRSVVKESVRRILSELDWRTYMSAAKKDKKGRSEKFADAANKEFDRQHGFDKHDKEGNTNAEFRAELDNDSFTTRERRYSDGKLYQRRKQPNDNYERYDKWEFKDNYPNMDNFRFNHAYRGPKDQFGDPQFNPQEDDTQERIKQAKQDLEDFYRGNSEYRDGEWKRGRENYFPMSY